MSKLPKIQIAQASDWAGIYIDGELVYQNHSIDWWDITQVLGIKTIYMDVDDDWFANLGELPEDVKAVKWEVEEDV